MRFMIIGSVTTILVFAVFVAALYIGWDAPTIACLPLDHGTRTRHFCIMNPFRDRQAEMIAEQILEELKAGNTNVLIPYLSERGTDDRDRYLSNESEYRITSWHNGEFQTTGEELSIQYWVSRSNYPAIREEVHFLFSRTEGHWKLSSYNATY